MMEAGFVARDLEVSCPYYCVLLRVHSPDRRFAVGRGRQQRHCPLMGRYIQRGEKRFVNFVKQDPGRARHYS